MRPLSKVVWVSSSHIPLLGVGASGEVEGELDVTRAGVPDESQ